MEIVFELNGAPMRLDAPPDRRLVDLLREDLGLTGTKEGCGTGECGACTILVEGETRLACLMVAAQVHGCRLTTVEGLTRSREGELVQRAFVEEGAVQCGFCIPGMELAALALLNQPTEPGREAIRQGLSGNLCRCSGYSKIVDAVERAAREIHDQRQQR